jgi:hypothetical protein
MKGKLTLTNQEYFHLASSIDRIKQSYKKLKPKEWEEGDKPLVKQLSVKFSTLAPVNMETFEIPLKRQHTRFLEAYCKASIKRLEEVILPAYKERGNKPEYEQQTTDLINKIKGILIKVEALL